MTTQPLLFDEKVFIPTDSHGTQLQIRHRRLAQQTTFDASRTIIMMHGATYSSGSLFDIPLEGQSFMDYLALAGFDVWAMDARGYGGSSRPAAMNQPAGENPPAVGAKEASTDLATAIDYLLQHLALEQINLLGMSWGQCHRLLYIAEQPADPTADPDCSSVADFPIASGPRWRAGRLATD